MLQSIYLGHVKVVVNGNVLSNEVINFFKNSFSVKPKSLKGNLIYVGLQISKKVNFSGRLTLMKGYDLTYYYEARCYITNVNILG